MLWKSSKVICLHVTLVIWHIAGAFDVKNPTGRPVHSNSNRSAYSCYPAGIFHDKAVGYIGISFCPSCHLSFHRSLNNHRFPDDNFIIPSAQWSCWGLYWFHSVRPSVRLSIPPSHIQCLLCSANSSNWIHYTFIHLMKQLQKVCHDKVSCKVSKLEFLIIFLNL